MYDQSQERAVFVASLPYMVSAKALALSKGMNDHGPLHAQRVHAIIGRLCALLPLSVYERDLVCAAALLHDIGMAKDRENHHVVSAELVRALAEETKLPFTTVEAEIVSTLCEWHRRDYDADAVHSESGIRTGVLASLLRLADALDLDYRRAEDYLKQEPVIAHVHQTQAPHHLSVRSILGVRLYASQMGTEVQLLVDQMTHAGLQLERLVDELLGTPITWPIKLIPVRRRPSAGHIFNTVRGAAVFSYCNAHGIIQAGMSKSALDMAGFSTTVICDKERTGSPPKFWEKTVPHLDLSKFKLIAILGLDIPEENIQQFLKIVRQNPECRWVYATPLEQTSERVAALLNEGVDVVVGDARLLFAGDALAEHAAQWSKIAGLCNADDWLTSSGSFSRKEFLAARGLRLELLELFESRADNDAYVSLINRVASGSLDSFITSEKGWTSVLAGRMPAVDRRDRVLILQDCQSMPGRFIYDLAHLAIEQQGILPWDQNEFATPYAICRLPVSDGSERILYLSRFSRLEGAVPIKYFVSYSEHQLGSGATIWQTYPTKESADAAIDATVQNINRFFSCEN
ncbi:HD domain-containing protein [Geomonas subterranea]|uniref:HD domain-containing protein n=1 Tax=Geomonas subterranea TaxID=2847989 RepID=A0ABX8LKA1_9BACT|nr:HD domain-containing protein [Geomonas subterranea]QXE91272.1 HD domain-containing protein [Geomonas subterranea]QXM10641.1 HD domain-containing protein [Geomonas subterranea]